MKRLMWAAGMMAVLGVLWAAYAQSKEEGAKAAADDWPQGGEAKNQLQLTLKAVRSTYKAGEKIELKARLANLSDEQKNAAEAKQTGYSLFNPQFDMYIVGKGNNGTQYMNLMGFFGGDKKAGLVLAAKASHTWDVQQSTQPKMVTGTPYGKDLPPGQYKVKADGAGLKSNEVEIKIE